MVEITFKIVFVFGRVNTDNEVTDSEWYKLFNIVGVAEIVLVIVLYILFEADTPISDSTSNNLAAVVNLELPIVSAEVTAKVKYAFTISIRSNTVSSNAASSKYARVASGTASC